MSRFSEELLALARAGEQAAATPPVELLRSQVRRRRVRRTAGPVAACAALVAGAIAVLPLVRDATDAPAEDETGSSIDQACGLTVEGAAGAAFDADEVIQPGDGLATVVAGTNRTVEEGTELSLGLQVTLATSGIDRLELVPGSADIDHSSAVVWLVDDDRVVGAAVADRLTGSGGHLLAGDGAISVSDGTYTLRTCDGSAEGAPAGTGDYELVAAVGLVAATTSGPLDGATTAAVLSEPVPVTVVAPDPLADLGTCGSVWPAAVVTTTDGYELGLRMDAGPFEQVNDSWRATLAVRNTSAEDLAGSTGYPTLVLLDADGVVVGGTGPQSDVGLDGSIPGGGTLGVDGWVQAGPCPDVRGGGDPLPAGEYDVHAIMDFFLDSPAGRDGPTGNRTDVTVIGGPWPLEIP